MSNDDLTLFGGLDQPIPKNADEIMQRIDEALKRSVREKKVEIALNVCKQLVAASEVAGLGLAKALYFIEKNWEKYGVKESFDDVVFDYIGKHKHTVERYVKVWGLFDNSIIPQDHQEELQQASIGHLIPIANAVYQGYDISEETWDKLAEAPDVTTVLKIVREDVKGKPPKPGSLQLYIDRDGSVWAFFDNERYFVGSLETSAKEEPIKKACERIIKNSGMLEQ